MQQLTNLTKPSSLSLGHLFVTLNGWIKKWPSDKLIIFVTVAYQIQFINLSTYLEVTRYNLCILLIGLNTSSKDVLLLYKPWPHSDISPFSHCCFSWPRHFFVPKVFLFTIS